MTDDKTPPGGTPADEAPRMEKRHRRTVLRVILVSHLCLALLTGVGVSLAYSALNGNIAPGEKIEHMAEPREFDGPDQPLNILVLGSDSRDGAGNAIDANAGGGERSDTTILLHVSADRKDAYGVSLPRDALVDRPDCRVEGESIPGEKLAMFNSAFAVGGAQCTIQTVEALTDVYIDHFITLDFNGFKDMVEAVNGVEVCLPEPVDDPEHDIYLDAGTQTLSPEDALNYVRERSVLSVTGDIGRMKRQQAFIGSMVNKVMSAGTLSRPERVYSFLDAVTGSIEVDEDLDSVAALFDLATEFRGTGVANIKFLTVPFEEYAPEPGRLVWTDDADMLWDRIRRDAPLGKEFSDGSLSADDPVGTASGSPSEDSAPTPEAEEDSAARLEAGLCA